MIFSKKVGYVFYVGLLVIYGLGEFLIDVSSPKPSPSNIAPLPNPTVKKITNTKEPLLYAYKSKTYLKEKEITSLYDQRYTDYLYSVSLKQDKRINVAAKGIDDHFHLANYYLEGFAPFETDKLWVPLYTLGTKKTYQLDHIQYAGRKEVWQTSSQAFKFTRGDCEDHAIALADWLISMKEDARVVIGKYKKEGHAWVVLFKDDKEYILEATKKRGLKQPYRLARYETHYKPQSMFNREHFWLNTGSMNTTRYESAKWIKKSLYIKG
jgi:hypothetical protein